MRYIKRFLEDRNMIKKTDIDGLLIDIMDNGFIYSVQESEIGININEIRKARSEFNTKEIYDTIKTLEDFVLANKARIIYDIYTIEEDDDGEPCTALGTSFDFDSIDDSDISWMSIRIRY